MPKTRKAMIDTMNSLVGLNEKDGSFKVIIDTYNKLRPAGSYKMKYTDAWCACTVSTCAFHGGDPFFFLYTYCEIISLAFII